MALIDDGPSSKDNLAATLSPSISGQGAAPSSAFASLHSDEPTLLSGRGLLKAHGTIGACVAKRELSSGESCRRVFINGAGVAGAVAAFHLASSNNVVTVFERGQPPSVSQPSDSRKFPFTINAVGRAALGPALLARLKPLGVVVVGRAVHTSRGIFCHRYGRNLETDNYLAIDRDVFRSVIAQAAIEKGADFIYGAEVVGLDVDGHLEVRMTGAETRRFRGDLFIGCDGTRGFSRVKLASLPGVSSFCECEPHQYVTGLIEVDNAKRCGLEPRFLQFWPSPEGVSIAVPNLDGSFTLLIVGAFPGAFDSAPFENESAAREFLTRRNRHLLRVQPDLPVQITSRKRGAFYTTAIDRWTCDGRFALCGDAGRSSPAWLGTGACLAMDDASELSRVLSRYPTDLEVALQEYNRSRIMVSAVIQQLIAQHGRLLMTRLGSRCWTARQRTEELLERVLGRRTLFQRVAFDPGGLAREVFRLQVEQIQS